MTSWYHDSGRFKNARPHYHGPKEIVSVDVRALRHRMTADGRPQLRLESDAGLSTGAIHRVLERGRCHRLTLDALCDALAIHDSEVTS